MKARLLTLSISLSVSLLAPFRPLVAQVSSDAHQLSLAAGNDEWTSTGLKVGAGDLVAIFASGKITVGPVAGEVDSDGRNNSGTLLGYGFIEGKVGSGAPFHVGQRFPFTADQPGTLKLRIYDTKYPDNSGAFTVTVYHIVASQVPEVTSYTPED